MLRSWIEDVIGRLRQLGSHADGLEDENRRLQSELANLLQARRDNDDTFTVRQWDPSGTTLVDTIFLLRHTEIPHAFRAERPLIFQPSPYEGVVSGRD
jgi:flagellar hook-associated protein FlgK